jgi:phospholipase C
MTHEVEEIAVDGLMLFGAGLLEEWAEKAIANHRFPGVAVKMTEGYLNSMINSLTAAETEMERDKDRLAIAEQRYSDWSSPFSANPAHSWQAIHREWDNGALDGFYTTNGKGALEYYDGADLHYYYALANAFTLCGHYFSYQLGPTFPNRLGLWTGTSGGNTTNNIKGGSLDWPTIVDLLDQHNLSWKCYNLGLGRGSDINVLEGFNALAFFKKWQHDPRLQYEEED